MTKISLAFTVVFTTILLLLATSASTIASPSYRDIGNLDGNDNGDYNNGNNNGVDDGNGNGLDNENRWRGDLNGTVDDSFNVEDESDD
ncbi:hypothetical protein G9A89_010935 [Geosiphon pyriformis]|nr:hypothetical protein G9A89_010935 [Geosiphon pyriformis]